MRNKSEKAQALKYRMVEVAKNNVLALVTDNSWSEKYYVSNSLDELDRRLFAGTLH